MPANQENPLPDTVLKSRRERGLDVLFSTTSVDSEEEAPVNEEASPPLEPFVEPIADDDAVVDDKARQALLKEVDELYEKVVTDLNTFKEDVDVTLKALRQAKKHLRSKKIEDYDNASHLVYVVRTTMACRQQLIKWSYTWGVWIFIYAFVWFLIFLAGVLFRDYLLTWDVLSNRSQEVSMITAAWFSALAGGIGGVTGILHSLSKHVSIRQDFDRQYVMYYLIQPVMGFVLGAVVYYCLGAGFNFMNVFSGPNPGLPADLPTTTEGIKQLSELNVLQVSLVGSALQVLFGWIAGFRQQLVFEMVASFINKIMPVIGGEKKPVSAMPEDPYNAMALRHDNFDDLARESQNIPISDGKPIGNN